MSEVNTKREWTKTLELARKYSKQGFEVLKAPRGDKLPEFLRHFNFQPDLIATSEKQKYVIEVTSRKSAKDLDRLAPIIEAINKEPSWEFLLVMTNPRESRDFKNAPLHFDEIQLVLKRVRALSELSKQADNEYDEAVFLFAWTVIEATLRMYLHEERQSKPPRTTKSLIRDAVIQGFVDRREGDYLNQMMDIRNAISHGVRSQRVSRIDLDKLLKITTALAEDTSKTAP
jgi:uncharacterized protein YutE (UPF0331/DUF86 family)